MHLGSSIDVGKDAIKAWIKAHIPEKGKVLDMGAGGGAYQELLKDCNYTMDAVEKFSPTIPYIVNLYRKIYCIDLKDFIFNEDYDLVILGDVLEHLTIEDAQKSVQNILKHTKYLIVVVPFNAHQDQIEDNPDEAHKQEDLNILTMQKRYPQLELLLYYLVDWKWLNGHFEYAYYIGKGELNEQ